MKRVAFHTLGCKVNLYETKAMEELVQAAGYGVVDFSEKADIYIVNTCSVTNIADKKSRQLLHKAKKENPHAVVVAVGCYVQSAEESLKRDGGIDIIVGNNRKKEIASILNGYFEEKEEETGKSSFVIDINKTNEYEELLVSKMSGHTRAFIKIQDGCNQFCTYCIIPYTRGRVRSRSAQEILEEIKGLVQAGYREFVLTGIHLTSYGADFLKEREKTVTPLLTLIRQIGEMEGVSRIRLGSLEPRIIDDAFVESLGAVSAFCPHFHLSLQSGCDETLRRMNRRYTTEDFARGVDLIRRHFMHPAITTDIIVGFPGETEEEFEASRRFVETIGFFEPHIFPYSKREGTKAAGLPGQVDKKTKAQRASVLSSLGETMSREFLCHRLGKEEEVLMEEELETEGGRYMMGHTKEYIRVAVPYRENLKNKLVRGTIGDFLKTDLLRMKDIVHIG